MELEGKWALVTGGNSGIGKEVAAALAGKGASVIIASRNTELGQDAAQDIRQRFPSAEVVVKELDLGSQASVRRFAEEFKASERPLHIVVANAGANFPSNRLTPEGVPLMCQVNYLGHYTLARMLEGVLVASAPSRVVSVSSVTSRFCRLHSPAAFLSQTKHASYGESKLAQIMFTYELQRRLGHLGVDASAVDPGGVQSNIWKGRFNKFPYTWYVRTFLAPAFDGAKAVVHAATVDYKAEQQKLNPRKFGGSRKDFRFYSKGGFASPLTTWYGGPGPGPLGHVSVLFCQLTSFVASITDWPLRNVSKGKLFGQPKRCTTTEQSYDPIVARDLWNRSAKIAGLPEDPSS